MRINGPSRQHLEDQGNEFADMVAAGIRQAVTIASKDLKATSTPDDLAVIRRVFNRYVETTLVPHLAKVWSLETSRQRTRLFDAAATAAAVMVPPVAQTLSEQYLATASNRLVGVSDEIWEHARTEMVAGMQAGESIPQLRKRVQAATGLAKPRAESIARTEVIGASNRGSLEQMKAAGYPATKEWLATKDDRTRPAHRDVSGTEVDLDATFTVGGAAMDGPHDPSGPPGETINCRCTLTYQIANDELTPAPTDADEYREPVLTSLGDWDLRALTQLDDATKDIRKYGRGDHALEDMWRQQGFDRAPAVRPNTDLDAEIARGGLEAFRGYQGAEGAQWAQQFANGATSYGGKGIYGNGTYFSYKPDGQAQFEARLYAHKDGVVQRVVLRANANIITFDDLIEMMQAEKNLPAVLQDPGRYATAKGYDAILGEQENHLNLLNRTALIVEET